MHEVEVKPRSSYGFESLLSGDAWREWMETVRGRRVLDGRTIWNVNTTASGGGVAEMLWSLVAYARGVGIDTRWLVMEGDERFFRLTKRIHNMLHGANGDGLGLGAEDHRVYEEVSRVNADDLLARTRPGDIVLLHDPQTAGMTPLVRADRFTVWRSHIGMDALNEQAHRGWAFLADYIEPAHRYVFTRRQYAPPGLDPGRIVVIPPSIDAFAEEPAARPRHGPGDPGDCRPRVRVGGGDSGARVRPHRRNDRDRLPACGAVRAAAAGTAPLVLEVSRWARLKDPSQIIRGFSLKARPGCPKRTSFRAAPPRPDDPGGANHARDAGGVVHPPDHVRDRVHLADLPMDDQGGTPRSSMRCSATLRSWCRSPWPKASGSLSPRLCGSTGQSWPAAWAASRTSRGRRVRHPAA